MASVVPIALGVFNAVGQIKAGKQAEQMAEYNAKATQAETEEAMRRLSKTQDQTKALARARALASGVKLEGSNELYINDMADEMAREMDWARKSGASRADVERLQGAYAKQSAKWSALGSIAGGISQGGQLANWWGLAK